MALLSGIRRVLGGTSTGRLLLAKDPFCAVRSSPIGLGAVRDFTTKLFISGLSRQTTDEGLRAKFSEFGQLVEARVVTDRISGRSRGFGFVRYATLEDAAKGKEGMDDYAKPREPKPPPPPEEPNPHGLNIQKTIGWCG